MCPGSQEGRFHLWVHLTQHSQSREGTVQLCSAFSWPSCECAVRSILKHLNTTKLVKELEGLSSEEWPRTLGLSILEKTKPERTSLLPAGP